MEPKKITMRVTKLESRTKHSQSLDIHIEGFGLAMHFLLRSEDMLVLSFGSGGHF